MRFVRYSAVPQFGVPVDNMESLSNAGSMIRLMEAYSIEPVEIPTEPTDITPYYWRTPDFRYFASLAHPEGPAVVDMLPNKDGAENYTFGLIPGVVIEGMRRTEVPTDVAGQAIVGPSPRFPDLLICMHELITVTE